ncbi:hypothetical protein VTP01DRAFT_7242 [Rhizomucor pusillus]|uniref:uncharacterized protein n=1 Tax=Rhizomucor pusillus TaxID=4840 RepID=UPI003744117F
MSAVLSGTIRATRRIGLRWMTCWIRIADSTSLVTSTATRKRPSRSTACCMRTSGHYWLSSRRAQPAAGSGAPLSPPGISMEPYKVPDPQRTRQCGAIHIVWYRDNTMYLLQLRDSGVHMYGFGITSALRAYRIFLRPILEYGPLLYLTKAASEGLEETQRQCLRMCLLRNPKEKAIGTVHLQTLFALPRMHIRYWVLQTKFALRARTLPPDTLVACVIHQLCKHPREAPWGPLRRNVLWAHVRKHLMSPGDRPRTSTAALWEGVEKLMQADIDKLVNTPDKFVTVKRGLRRPVWDSILSLPCSKKERHRLLNGVLLGCLQHRLCQPVWRSQSEPGSSLLLPSSSIDSSQILMVVELSHPDPSTGAEAIDTALNLLASKVPSNLGRWKTLWPALLHLLLLIDQITSPTPFEDEPRPGTLLLEASQNLASR